MLEACLDDKRFIYGFKILKLLKYHYAKLSLSNQSISILLLNFKTKISTHIYGKFIKN